MPQSVADCLVVSLRGYRDRGDEFVWRYVGGVRFRWISRWTTVTPRSKSMPESIPPALRPDRYACILQNRKYGCPTKSQWRVPAE